MKDFITNFLQTLVRIIFGIFIGGFFGLVVGGFIEVMLWIEKRNFQSLEEMTLFIVIGALVGAFLGASNMFAATDTKTKPKNGRSVGGNGNKDGDGGNGGWDGG